MTTSPIRFAILAGERDALAVLAAALDAADDLVYGTPGDCDVTIVYAPEAIDGALVAKAAGRVATIVLGPESQQDLVTALEAGASGYLRSDATSAEIASAIRSVIEGVAVVPPLMLGEILRMVVDRRRRESAAQEVLAELTPRERDVLRHAVTGARRSDIAQALYISAETVRTHLQRIMSKLGVHSQAELVALASDLAWVEDGGENA
jgi:DNA-binding NarL/FixJ family response regulator